LRVLGRALGGPSLVIVADEEFVWAWFAVAAAGASEWARSVASFAPPERTAIALGSAGAGVDGFRRTHREAQRAYLVARHRSAPVRPNSTSRCASRPCWQPTPRSTAHVIAWRSFAVLNPTSRWTSVCR